MDLYYARDYNKQTCYKHLPYSLSISCPTRTVSLDCNKTELNSLNMFGSSDTLSDSALNAISVSKPPELCISSNASLEITPSVYNICVTSIGRTSFESLGEYFWSNLLDCSCCL